MLRTLITPMLQKHLCLVSRPMASSVFRPCRGASGLERPGDRHPGYAKVAGDPGLGHTVRCELADLRIVHPIFPFLVDALGLSPP